MVLEEIKERRLEPFEHQVSRLCRPPRKQMLQQNSPGDHSEGKHHDRLAIGGGADPVGRKHRIGPGRDAALSPRPVNAEEGRVSVAESGGLLRSARCRGTGSSRASQVPGAVWPALETRACRLPAVGTARSERSAISLRGSMAGRLAATLSAFHWAVLHDRCDDPVPPLEHAAREQPGQDPRRPSHG